MIEALAGREKFRVVSEVPFTDHHRRIAGWFENLRKGYFVEIKTDGVLGEKDAGDRNARVVATGHQAGARHRADTRGVETRELHALGGQFIEVRGAEGLVAEGPNVGVTHIIDEN